MSPLNSLPFPFHSTWNRSIKTVWGLVFVALLGMATPKPSLAQNGEGISQTVKVVLQEGTTLQGKLVSIHPSSVAIDQGGKKQEIPSGNIRSLVFAENQWTPPGTFQLTLIDGSKLVGTGLVGRANEWKWTTSLNSIVDGLSTKNLRILQVKAIPDQQLATWNDSIADTSQNDSLIVARPNGDVTRVGGTILELKDGQMVFEFDDQKIEMPLPRLLGATWYQSANDRIKPGIEVRTSDHSVWNAETLVPKADSLMIGTASGVSSQIKWSELIEIRFGSANLRWVAELEALESKSEHPVAWKYSIDKAKSAFLPRFVQTRAVASNTSQASEKDLLFSQPGTYSFRMPEGFTRLEARVQRSDAGEIRAPLSIEVWQDESKVFALGMSTDQEYIDVKAVLEPEKRVRLIVTSSSPSNTGTEVQWKQPRLLR